MENRTIMVANTKTQQRHEINTNATTLGELKAAMAEAGIDYYGMTFTEGISKTQLLTDDSILPTNVMYKGTPTNNLVMLLTNTTKQISSGCEERTRKEAYAILKEWGEDAKEDLMAIYGKNYTLLKTEVLWQYIDDNSEVVDDEDEDEEKKVKVINPAPKAPKAAPHADLVEILYLGLKALVNHNALFIEDVAVLADLAKEFSDRKKEEQPKITDDDINDMINSL